MRNKKPIKFLIFTFLLLGTIFTCVGVVMNVININIRTNYTPVEATITGFESRKTNDNTDDMHTIIDYTLHGEEYSTVLWSYSSSWEIGDTITVYSNPNHPDRITQGVPKVIGILFPTIGLTAIIIAVYFLRRERRLAKKKRDLMENGLTLKATVVDFSVNTNIAVNQRHPFVVEVEYDEFGQKHRFKSEYVWQNVTSLDLGKEVTVFYQHNNMDNYYVDIDEIFTQDDNIDTNIIYH